MFRHLQDQIRFCACDKLFSRMAGLHGARSEQMAAYGLAPQHLLRVSSRSHLVSLVEGGVQPRRCSRLVISSNTVLLQPRKDSWPYTPPWKCPSFTAKQPSPNATGPFVSLLCAFAVALVPVQQYDTQNEVFCLRWWWIFCRAHFLSISQNKQCTDLPAVLLQPSHLGK